MSRVVLLFASLAVFVSSALGDHHGSWTLDDYKDEYEKLQQKYDECKNSDDDNPSLISWSEAETALFVLLAVVVVLLLLFAIVLINYCAEKGKSKKEDKSSLVEGARY